MKTYHDCAAMFARRKKSNDFKRYSHNQRLYYDECGDTYWHQHHSTRTVGIHNDGTYTLNTGGWNTSTTWRKMREFAPFRVWVHGTPAYGGGKMLWWDNGAHFQPYYDRVRVDSDGVPLLKKLTPKRVLRRSSMKEFNKLAHHTRALLLPRVLAGEFDGGLSIRCMEPAALLEWMENLTPEFVPHEEAEQFLAQREKQCFGRPLYNRWSRRNEEREVPSARTRFETSIGAARTAYMRDHAMYDTIMVNNTGDDNV